MKLSYGFPILFVLVEAIFAVEQQPLHKTAQLSKSPDKCVSSPELHPFEPPRLNVRTV